MPTLEQLRQKLEKLVEEQKAIFDGAKDDSGEARSLNKEEKEKFDALERQAEELKEEIERRVKVENSRQMAIELEKPIGETPRVHVIREDGFNEDGDYRGFKSFDEYIRSVVRAGMNQGVDERLNVLTRAASGASEGVGADGGFAVQSDFAEGIFDKARAGSELASRCTVVPIGSNSNELVLNLVDETSRADGSRFGGVRGYWREEAGSVTATNPKLRRQRLQLESLDALYYATEELIQDSTAMSALVSRAFVEELGFKLQDAIINGDGSGKPQGILNSGGLVSQAKETSQTAATVNSENVRKMKNRMYAPSRAGAIWICNQDVIPQLEQMVLAGTSSDVPLWLPAGGLASRENDMLYGHPVIPVEQCAALGTVGDLLFVNMAEYLLIKKGGIKAASSAHVRFIYGEMTFRWTQRVNGMSLWNSALTPYQGSTTRSPFVGLATRA